MKFEISFNDGDNGSSFDGFLSFTSRGTQDGEIPPASFYVSDNGEKAVLDAFKKDGVVMDIYYMRTGWGLYDGSSTQYKWNNNLVDWEERPGDEWKKGLQIDCYADKKIYLWRQTGVGVMEAFKKLAGQFGDKADGKLPVVKMTKAEVMKFKNGTQTSFPILEVVDWVERPFPLEAKLGNVVANEEPEF